jgi:hypothetical protein
MSDHLEAVLTDGLTPFLRIKATLGIENITVGGSRGLWNFSMFL